MAYKIGIIGAGNIGGALARGILAKGIVLREDMILSVKSIAHKEELERSLGIRTVVDNGLVAAESDTVIVAVKPRMMADLLDSISPRLDSGKLIVSAAAGIGIELMEAHLPAGMPVIRTMPNMAVSLGEGMTVLSPGTHVSPERLEWARFLFGSVGRAIVLGEEHMNAVTGLSGSGPAYIYLVIEALSDGGVKMGLPREVATELAAQTVLGAALNVLRTGEHPAKLKDQVTTPAGVTIDGLLELEAGGLRVTLIKAVVKAAERAGQLVHKPKQG